jgi:glucose dehydrogenase
MDHGGQEVRVNPIQCADRHQYQHGQEAEAGVDILHRFDPGHEAAPLVVNNTMYIVTPWPNILYAQDLTKPGAPVRWSYKPKPQPSSWGVRVAMWSIVGRLT